VSIKEYTAVIPIRSGSKGLPKKNIRPFLGSPLYTYTLNQAKDLELNRIIISTDESLILNAKPVNGVEVIKRPQYLSGDDVEMNLVIKNIIETCCIDGPIILLQVTSPLRKKEHIEEAIHVFDSGKFDLIMSVTKADSSALKWGTLDSQCFTPLNEPDFCFKNRQNLPFVYKPNGALYIFHSQSFLKNDNFPTTNIGVIEMTSIESLDIDTLQDFNLCEETFIRTRR